MIDADGKYAYSMIQNVDLSGSFSVYPNPASYSIIIEHPLNAKGVITITDVLGRVVNELNTSMGNSITTVSIAALSKGQYVVKYTDGTFTNVRSFVKE